MDLAKALAELREQRDRLDQAILSLERLEENRPRGRGRPRTRPARRPRPRVVVSGESRGRANAGSEVGE